MSYRSLTIDHTQCGSADTSDFPYKFSGTFGYLATVANGGEVESASGFDIVFCTNPVHPLSSKLNFERVDWNAMTGVVEFWVRIPTLTHAADYVLYIYYGDASIVSDQQNVNGTWDSKYLIVQHFGDGSGVVLTDSTSNGLNGTNHGATVGASLLNGGGGASIAFASASSEYVDFGTSALFDLTASMTVQAIISNASQLQGVLSKTDLTNGYCLVSHGSFVPQQTIYTAVFKSGVETDCFGQGNDWVAGVNAAAMTYDNANLKFYAFGLVRNTTSGIGLIGSTAAGLNLGRLAFSYYFDGSVDEVRIANVPLSPSQLLAEYNNTLGGSFTTIGPEIGPGAGVALITQSAVEIMVLSFPNALVSQSAIELVISPPPPVPPPIPGQPQVIVGGVPEAAQRLLGNCKPKNGYDECLLRIEDLWRHAKIPSRYKPCIGLDTSVVPWEPDYAALPAESEPFRRIGTILCPTTAAGDTVVCSIAVPNGYDGILTGMFQVYEGTGFLQGSGDILWRIKSNLRYLKDLGSVPYAYGTVALPAPLTEGFLLLSDQLIQYIVDVPNLSGNIQVGIGRITCGLFGFFWPRNPVIRIRPEGEYASSAS